MVEGEGPADDGAPPPPAYYPAPFGVYTPPPPHLKPSTNIGWAIAALLLFAPVGIPSLLAAVKVDDLYFRGDIAGAQKASSDARKWGIIGLVLAIAFFVLSMVFFAVAFSHVIDSVDKVP